MSDTIDELNTLRSEAVAKLRSVVKGYAAHSVGDRSFSEHDPETLQRVIDRLDRRIAALQAPNGAGRTYMRLGRGRR